MLSSSTHDSKRSEDVRARIDVLSEIPALWRLALRRWKAMNRRHKRLVNETLAPSRNDEFLLYQTLVGIWPSELLDDAGWQNVVERIEQYMLKAAREAKEHTSWVNARAEYEEALTGFVRKVLDRRSADSFVADFAEFHRPIARAGALNSLSQCLLKLTAPGVPDIYQGTELLDLSLVDPDNRRCVDYGLRRTMLQKLQGAWPDQLKRMYEGTFADANDNIAKLLLISRVLAIRKTESALFNAGSYSPVEVTGEKADHVCAFERHQDGRSAIIVAPRLWATLLGPTGSPTEDLWEGTNLMIRDAAEPCYQNMLTGECVPVSSDAGRNVLRLKSILRTFPVALLLNQPCDEH